MMRFITGIIGTAMLAIAFGVILIPSEGRTLVSTEAAQVRGGDADHKKCVHTDYGYGTDPCVEQVWCSSLGICELNSEHELVLDQACPIREKH